MVDYLSTENLVFSIFIVTFCWIYFHFSQIYMFMGVCIYIYIYIYMTRWKDMEKVMHKKKENTGKFKEDFKKENEE